MIKRLRYSPLLHRMVCPGGASLLFKMAIWTYLHDGWLGGGGGVAVKTINLGAEKLHTLPVE